METGDDFERTSDSAIDALRRAADADAEISSDVLYALAEDHDHIAQDLNDTVVHQMFSVSLDLHAALSRIDHDIDAHHAAGKIRHAITSLDQAINDLRNAVVGFNSAVPSPTSSSPAAGTREA